MNAVTTDRPATDWLPHVPSVVVDGVQVFDCRWPEGTAHPRAPWGETILGSEMAAVQLGLRAGWGSARHDTVTCSMSYAPDTRKDPRHFDRLRSDILEQFRRQDADYRDALANPAEPGAGGGVYCKPVAVAICNFGASVICDDRLRAVRASRGTL